MNNAIGVPKRSIKAQRSEANLLWQRLQQEQRTVTEAIGVVDNESRHTVYQSFGPIQNKVAAAKIAEITSDYSVDGKVHVGDCQLAEFTARCRAALEEARAARPVEDHTRSLEEEAKRIAQEKINAGARQIAQDYNRALCDEVRRHAPANADAVILAKRQVDTSDIQSDYSGHTTAETVVIGYRTGKREDFRQLRKAAATFPATAHMGPGCDEYTPRVFQADDLKPENWNGCGYRHKGQYSAWHRALDEDEHGRRVTFTTQAEAEAYIAAKGQPGPIMFGDQEVHFEWKLAKESIEHRECYSMGAGNYLKAGHRDNDGWQVSSTPLSSIDHEDITAINLG